MSIRLGVLLTLLIGLLLPALARYSDRHVAGFTVHTINMGTVRTTSNLLNNTLAYTDDGTSAAIAYEYHGETYLLWNGRRLGPYDRVERLELSRSGGGGPGYIAVRGERSALLVNGRTYHLPAASSPEMISPDGRRLVWTVQVDKRKRVVIDGRRGPTWDTTGEFIFSPDSRHLAYSVTNKGKACVVRDGVPGGWYNEITNLAYSPDGRHLAFIAQRGRQVFVVLDGRGVVNADTIKEFAFTGRGNHLAVVGVWGGRSHLLIGGRTLGNPGQLRDVTWTPDGAHVAYYEKPDNRLVIDGGTPKAARQHANPVVLSPDGRHYATVVDLPQIAPKKATQAIERDGVLGAPHNTIESPVFSTNSRHLTYGAQDGKTLYLVTDGNKRRVTAPESATAYPEYSDDRFISSIVRAPWGNGLAVHYNDFGGMWRVGRLCIPDLGDIGGETDFQLYEPTTIEGLAWVDQARGVILDLRIRVVGPASINNQIVTSHGVDAVSLDSLATWFHGTVSADGKDAAILRISGLTLRVRKESHKATLNGRAIMLSQVAVKPYEHFIVPFKDVLTFLGKKIYRDRKEHYRYFVIRGTRYMFQ
jgi:hypothetical protein